MPQRRARTEEDELRFGAGEADVEAAPVFEEVADLRASEEKGERKRSRLAGERGREKEEETHISRRIRPHERDDDNLLITSLTPIGREDLDARKVL